MKCLRLTLRPSGPQDLDLSPLTPSALSGKTTAQVLRVRLRHGRRTRAVADLFEPDGEHRDGHLELRGLTTACHHVGADMTAGVLDIRGDVGGALGAAMRGGEISLHGNCGDSAGAGMRGGVIRIHGNAGDAVGGPLTGVTRGMNGGTIIIDGNAGNQIGARMRRGLLIVRGNSGDTPGARMIAGTIIVCGSCGDDPGAGMRRGTVMLVHAPAALPATFNLAGEFEFGFMPLLIDHAASFDRKLHRLLAPFRRAQRWSGDMAFGGKGEILVAAAGQRR